MNKVITVNLAGTAYQLEDAGYDALRAYLDTASARLQGNPDRDEIIADIERAIAEKFRALLGSYKTVVEVAEVATVLTELGPVEAAPAETAGPGAGAGAAPEAPAANEPASDAGCMPRRLYRIREGAMISGVCNGIAAYLNLDPSLVRIAFILLTFLGGITVLVYVVMVFVVPEARSPEQRAAASGAPFTAREFIRRAKEGYYDAMKEFPDRKARREWKRKFHKEMRAEAWEWRQNWHYYWAQHAVVHPGMGFTLPVLSLLQGAATLLWLCALVSVLATGALFDRPLPSGLPAWAAALLLCVGYCILISPLKLARRACQLGFGPQRPAWGFVFLIDALIWLAVVAALVWLAVIYFPELQEAIRGLPTLAHQALHDVETWWNHQQ